MNWRATVFISANKQMCVCTNVWNKRYFPDYCLNILWISTDCLAIGLSYMGPLQDFPRLWETSTICDKWWALSRIKIHCVYEACEPSVETG